MNIVDLDKLSELFWDGNFMEIHKDDIPSIPSAFEGMTVGEVLKAVLGIEDEQIDEAKYLVGICPKGNHYDPFIAIKREVWNAPYQKGGEL